MRGVNNAMQLIKLKTYKNEPLIRFPVRDSISEMYKFHSWKDVFKKLEIETEEDILVEKVNIKEKIRKIENTTDIFHTIVIGNASDVYLYKEYRKEHYSTKLDLDADIVQLLKFEFYKFVKNKGLNTICNFSFVHREIHEKNWRCFHHYELVTFKEGK